MKQPRKTPTKEQKEWMKEAGYTEQQLDAFWNENIGTNPIITNLSKHNMTWRDMNLCVVQKLPTQKERDAKILEERKRKEEEERAEEMRKKQEKEYYNNHFEEIMIKKIDNKEPLTEHEIRTLVFEYDVETEHGDNRRWTRSVNTIVKLCDRYFSINWEEGLTEYQDNEFYNQPCEVRREEEVKTIVVVNWVKVNE